MPDIAYWVPGCLVLSPKSSKILKQFSFIETEFLPVSVEGEKGWTILNTINVQDALDKANCRYHIHSDGTVIKKDDRDCIFQRQNHKCINIQDFRIKAHFIYK